MGTVEGGKEEPSVELESVMSLRVGTDQLRYIDSPCRSHFAM
jgi:hypothetical protein